MRIIRGAENITCEKKLQELGLFSLGNGRMWRDMIIATMNGTRYDMV